MELVKKYSEKSEIFFRRKMFSVNSFKIPSDNTFL